jgi:hypothetical protein
VPKDLEFEKFYSKELEEHR